MLLCISGLLWLCFTCYALSLFVSWAQTRRRWSAAIDQIPGPNGYPLFGVSLTFITQREKLSAAGRELVAPFITDYPLIRLWLGPFPVVIILKSRAAKVVLNSNTHIDKAIFYRYLTNWVGNGILTSTGVKWHTRRKLLTPTFHFRILESFLMVMNEQSDLLVHLLSRKGHQEYFDITPYLTNCALDIVCATAMGQEIGAQLDANSDYVNAVINMGKVISLRIMRPWLAPEAIFKLSSLGRLEKRSLDVIHTFTDKIIKRKRKALKKSNCKVDKCSESDWLGRKHRVALLDLLLASSEANNNSSGPTMTDNDIREEVATFMFAGHDTIASGLSWALYFVGQHPQVQQKIHDELQNIFGDNSNRAISTEDLHNLKYLECVIKESMRLFAPIPMFGRALTEELDICGYKIPSGVTVLMVPHCIHRDPEVYPDPEEFNPDRFLPQNCQDRDPFAYIPFSAGPRNCIGQKFALMEMKVILSRFFMRFTLKSVEEPDLLSNVTMEMVARPIRGIRVKLEPRHKTTA